jgi:hypothetical protein
MEVHDFYAIQRLRSRVRSSKDAIDGIVNQRRRWSRYGVIHVDVCRLRAVAVNEDEMKSRNDEVYASSCFDRDLLGRDVVTPDSGRKREEPVSWGICFHWPKLTVALESGPLMDSC